MRNKENKNYMRYISKPIYFLSHITFGEAFTKQNHFEMNKTKDFRYIFLFTLKKCILSIALYEKYF